MTYSGLSRLSRREALQLSLMTLGASVVAGSAALEGIHEPAVGLFFNPEELARLAEIAEILIPTTDTPGARGANVHGFIDRVMAEDAVAQTQTAFRALLADIEATSKEQFGSSFLELSARQRADLVASMDAAAFQEHAHEELRKFPFAHLKELIFLGYYHSEVGATRELQFALVPGHFEGCAPLASIGRAWAGDPMSLLPVNSHFLDAPQGDKTPKEAQRARP